MTKYFKKVVLSSLLSFSALTLPAFSQGTPVEGAGDSLPATSESLTKEASASKIKSVADLIAALKAETDPKKQMAILNKFLDKNPDQVGEVAAAAIKANPAEAAQITVELMKRVPSKVDAIAAAAVAAAPEQTVAINQAIKDAEGDIQTALASDKTTGEKNDKGSRKSTAQVDLTLTALVSPSQ
jgi:hypothetical protein